MENKLMVNNLEDCYQSKRKRRRKCWQFRETFEDSWIALIAALSIGLVRWSAETSALQHESASNYLATFFILNSVSSRVFQETIQQIITAATSLFSSQARHVSRPLDPRGQVPVSQTNNNIRNLNFLRNTQSGSRTPLPRTESDDDEAKSQTEPDEFLEGLPLISVGEKHSASIECNLREPAESDLLRLVWVKSSRLNGTNDVQPISLDHKIISPDRRFKVRKQSGLKWILTIDKVTNDDNQAYFLCQASTPAKKNDSDAGFIGGAKLNVLQPPKFVDSETSPSLIRVNEFDSFSLKCKVVSEPQAQLVWKREDRRELDLALIEQLFKHEFERSKSGGQILSSIDSSELLFNSIGRNQSGAYLCIASNGVTSGISRRMNVEVINCRASSESAQIESCSRTEPGPASEPSPARDQPRNKSWKVGNGRSQQQQAKATKISADSGKRRPAPATEADNQSSSVLSIRRDGASSALQLRASSELIWLLALLSAGLCLRTPLAVKWRMGRQWDCAFYNAPG